MIEVTEEEKRLGRNHVEIIAEDVDIGYFEVDFVLPEDRLICGWWIPSEYVRQEMIKRNLITDVDKPPFWSAITYEFADTDIEKQLLQDGALASDFLRSIDWNRDNWYFVDLDTNRHYNNAQDKERDA